jgi:hypothetical protein
MIINFLKKHKYRIPKIGNILIERDSLRNEKVNLLNALKDVDKRYSKKAVDLKKISKKYNKKISGVEKYLKGKKNIFDIGVGPKGSSWWKKIDKGSSITGIDWYFFPEKLPKNVSVSKFNASNLDIIDTKHTWYKKHDLIVARHILEHVDNPETTVEGIANLCKKGAIVYTGFPDYRNFTDIFYHLIHPEGGGHIQLLTDKSVKKMFMNNGFKLIDFNIWPEDWLWLQQQFDYRNRGLSYTTQKEIDYICNVFRKELTLEKGYFYGYEMVFEKL